MANEPNQPSCIIPPELAEARIQLFRTTKKPFMDGLIGFKPEVDHLRYTVSAFVELLEFISEPKRGYDGLRVYFASHSCHAGDPNNRHIRPDGGDHLTLIFVPTKSGPTTEKGELAHNDDVENIKIIADGRLTPLPKPGGDLARDTTTRWVRHYREKLAALGQDGAKFTSNGGFEDTNSLWYPIQTFAGSKDSDKPGLTKYIIAESKSKDPLEYIVPQFACYVNGDTFLGKPLKYQLSLIFILQRESGVAEHYGHRANADQGGGNQGGGNQGGAKHANGKDAHARKPVLKDAPAGADTAYPCPPATNCIGSAIK